MEVETVDRIEHMARGLAVVLVALVGLQTLSGEIEGQMGPFATFAALACIGASWHARLVRECLAHRPKVFVIVVATCVAVMTAAFLAANSGPAPATSVPIG
jgi:uncharacterized membrane protein AbrB (regulator of aidB expression)